MRAKRNSIPFIYFLCILLLGMCLGNTPADSFFEYANTDSIQTQNDFQAAAIRSGSKAVPSAQIYKPRTFTQSEAALSLRQTTRRSSVRTGKGLSLLLCMLILFWLSLLCPASLYLRELIQEAASHTVIINYIHHQDGQKPSLL